MLELVVLVIIVGLVSLCRQRDFVAQICRATLTRDCHFARVGCCALSRFRPEFEVPVACDFRSCRDFLFVSSFLSLSTVVEDLFRDLVCALRLLTYPFKNIGIKLVYFVECVYCVCLVVQGFVYIL